MLRAEPWAEAFMNAGGTDEALEYLRLFCHAALALPGDLSGRNDADRIGASINAALKRSGQAGESAELAGHIVQLMLRRRCFRSYRLVLLEIEKRLNKQKGVEEVVAETAVPPDEELTARIRQKALEISGARDVKLTVRVLPELIGGLRLRLGGRLFDGSLKHGLQKMAADLAAGHAGSAMEA